jgi:LmbE family N-acetylglucosaminyl deacetylase
MFIRYYVALWTVLLVCCNIAMAQSFDTTDNQPIILSQSEPKQLPLHEWKDKTVLFMYAHIDDMEASSGGTVALLQGVADIHLAILTNGDKGCGNVDICGNSTNEEVALIRQEEQNNAAGLFGIPPENIDYLGYEDCELNSYPQQEIQKKLVTIIRKKQPNIVFTWDPSPKFEMIPSEGWSDMGYHPDHQVSGRISLDSVYNAHLARMWPDLGEAWRVDELYFWAFTPSRVPDFYVDITAPDVYNRKKAAFLQMHSQYTDPAGMTDFLLFLASSVGATLKLSEGSLAEGYNYILW